MGWDQVDIADRLGIHQRTVANYETGQTEPKLAMLLSWANLTNVPVDWLTYGIEPCAHCGQVTIHDPVEMGTRSKYSSASTLVSADNVIIADFERIAAGLEERVLSTDGARIYEFPQLPLDVEHPLGV
jgi:transcriptional regulator with XRE-family HTH domain